MKKKSIVKTIIDLVKLVFILAIMIVSLFLMLYLFIKIPIWILDILNLSEQFYFYPAVIMYEIEFFVILIIWRVLN